jgi:hypothetical protein
MVTSDLARYWVCTYHGARQPVQAFLRHLAGQCTASGPAGPEEAPQ